MIVCRMGHALNHDLCADAFRFYRLSSFCAPLATCEGIMLHHGPFLPLQRFIPGPPPLAVKRGVLRR